jgi:dTDP-4-dehydrorhamnose 3,5-epimerase
MKFIPTTIPDVVSIELHALKDERGFFAESFRADEMASAGISSIFVQDNHSGSHNNILRGLHYQIRQPQGKLVRAVTGEIFDVAVDLRRSSCTFGQWAGETLSAKNHKMLWIPPGFAHGFLVMSEWADVLYKASDYYSPEWERTLIWNDPAVAINWPLRTTSAPILSPKDARGVRLENADVYD